MDTEKLAAPFPPDNIHWRVGSTTKDKSRGLALAYLDARDVMDRLDEVVGPENWQDCYRTDGPRTYCTLSVNVSCAEEEPRWVSKEDCAGDTDIEGEKGGVSDAFKRAAVKWGIGRYLYRLESPWVELDDGRRIKKSEAAKLRAVLTGETAPKEPPAPKPDRPDPTAPMRTSAIKERLMAAMNKRCLEVGVHPPDCAEGALLSIMDKLGVKQTAADATAKHDIIVDHIKVWHPPSEGDDFGGEPPPNVGPEDAPTLGQVPKELKALHAWIGEEIGIRNSQEAHAALHNALPHPYESLKDLPIAMVGELKERVRANDGKESA